MYNLWSATLKRLEKVGRLRTNYITHHIYLHQAGYVFSVCLSVSSTTEKLLSWNTLNLVKGCSIGQRRTHYILEWIQITNTNPTPISHTNTQQRDKKKKKQMNENEPDEAKQHFTRAELNLSSHQSRKVVFLPM